MVLFVMKKAMVKKASKVGLILSVTSMIQFVTFMWIVCGAGGYFVCLRWSFDALSAACDIRPRPVIYVASESSSVIRLARV